MLQFGAFRRTKLGWQVSDGHATVTGVFHKLVPAAPPYEYLQVSGLEPERVYRVMTLPQSLRVGQFGNLLKHVLPVNVNPNGLLLHTADSYYSMEDGQQSVTASGAALMSGIPLLPLFRGTGYDKNQRTQGDFGSNVYVIEEETSHE